MKSAATRAALAAALVVGLAMAPGAGTNAAAQAAASSTAPPVGDGVDENALFADGAFDQAVESGKKSQAATGVLAGATFVGTGNFSLIKDGGAYSAGVGFSGKAFAKATLPDVAQLFVSYSLDHAVLEGSNDPATRTAFDAARPDPTAVKLQLSELYLSFDFGKVLFVRLGNQLLSWGASYFWSPADFINLSPDDSQAPVDTRAGKSGLRLHLPLQGANLFAFADFSRTVDALGHSGDLAATMAYAGRFDLTLSPFNFGINAYAGSGLPVRLGATAAGTVLGFDLWGEYAATLPVYGYAYAWAASLGGERLWGQDAEWRTRAEFSMNSAGSDDAQLSVSSAFTPYYWGKYYLYLYVSREKLFGGSSVLSLSGVANLSDLSFSATLGLSLRLPALLPLDFRLIYSGGQGEREFTVRTGGAAWTLQVQTILQI